MTGIPESLKDLTKIVCMDRSDSRRHVADGDVGQVATSKLTMTVTNSALPEQKLIWLFVLVESQGSKDPFLATLRVLIYLQQIAEAILESQRPR